MSLDLDAIEQDLAAPHVKPLADLIGAVGDGPATRLLAAVPVLVAEVKQLRRERDHEKRKAADCEDRYETSHASRMHAEDCYRSEHRAVERVRALHRHLTDEQGIEYCEWCDDNGADYGHELPLWPCPTIRALDGAS